MRRLLLVCAILFLCIVTLGAQITGQQRVKLTGTVLNGVTGEPVRGALVNVQGSDAKSTLSGPDGHFELDVLPGGFLSVIATRPGYAPPYPVQMQKVGSSPDPVVVKLNPLSRISGRITDREGEPIDGAQVQCMHQQLMSGRKQWQQANGATTDEDGRFLIEDLLPGTYILHTRPYQLYRTLQRKSEASRYIYAATFYPDAPSREMAQQIELAPGQEIRVDMELHSIRAARVSVATVPRDPNVVGSLTSGDDNLGEGMAQANTEGVLTFNAVPPGSWKVVVNGAFSGARRGNSDQMVYGEMPVDVGTTDIDNLTLPLSRPVDIPVSISGVGSPQAFVQLFNQNRPMGASNIDQSGELKIHSVLPGTYRVVARSNGTGCITSVTSGSQDLLREKLVVTPGSSVPPLQIVEGDNCPQLTITPNAKTNTSIIVTSTLQGFEPLQLFAGNNGSATVTLSPGEYQIYAFDDVSNLEYANPDAMRDFKSQTITLEPGQKTSLQVEVNERHAQ